MTDYLRIIDSLRRPRLLVHAAKHGLSEYSRSRDLRRLTHSPDVPTPEQALRTLLADEEVLEQTRQSGSLSYSIGRHIDVLIAIMAEAQLLPRRDQAGT